MAAMRNPCNDLLRFNRFFLKNGTFDVETTIAYLKNTLTFITVLTNINSVKPAESIFSNSTLLMGALLL